MVSKASEDLPEPLKPVMTTSLSRGILSVRFLRLCSRAPPILMRLLLTDSEFRYRTIGKPNIKPLAGKERRIGWVRLRSSAVPGSRRLPLSFHSDPYSLRPTVDFEKTRGKFRDAVESRGLRPYRERDL